MWDQHQGLCGELTAPVGETPRLRAERAAAVCHRLAFAVCGCATLPGRWRHLPPAGAIECRLVAVFMAVSNHVAVAQA